MCLPSPPIIYPTHGDCQPSLEAPFSQTCSPLTSVVVEKRSHRTGTVHRTHHIIRHLRPVNLTLPGPHHHDAAHLPTQIPQPALVYFCHRFDRYSRRRLQVRKGSWHRARQECPGRLCCGQSRIPGGRRGMPTGMPSLDVSAVLGLASPLWNKRWRCVNIGREGVWLEKP